MSLPIRHNAIYLLQTRALPGQSIAVSMKKNEAQGRVHPVLIQIGNDTATGYVTYDDYLKYSVTNPAENAAYSPSHPEIRTFYVSADSEEKASGHAPQVEHHRRPKAGQAHYEVKGGDERPSQASHFVRTRGFTIIPGKYTSAATATHDRKWREADRKDLFTQLKRDGFSLVTEGRKHQHGLGAYKSPSPPKSRPAAPAPTHRSAAVVATRPPVEKEKRTAPNGASRPQAPIAKVSPQAHPASKNSKVTKADAAALASLANKAAASLGSATSSRSVVSDKSFRIDPKTAGSGGATGGLRSGGGSSVITPGGRSRAIGLDAASSGSISPAASSATAAPTVTAPKTGDEFKVSGVEVSPGKNHVYSADFRKPGDTSESHLLTFTQFVQVTSRGGHDVKFELTLSKDLLKTPESRNAVKERIVSVVSASMAREGMTEDERLGLSEALKMKLNDTLAKMAVA